MTTPLPPLRLTAQPELLLEILQHAMTESLEHGRKLLNEQLTDSEKSVQDYVEQQAFIDRSWYRPIHNILVPLVMTVLCREHSLSRDLVLAAQLHDIGYAGVKVSGTLTGMAWQNADIRSTHMLHSAKMSAALLRSLCKQGTLLLSETRIDSLVAIIGTHDDPYLGRPLSDPEALAHRDADRAFVISCVSFWKDFIAWSSDSAIRASISQAGLQQDPDTFLQIRCASFTKEANKTLQDLNEAGFEPWYLSESAQLCNRMEAAIREEISLLSAEGLSPDEAKELLTRSIKRELSEIVAIH